MKCAFALSGLFIAASFSFGAELLFTSTMAQSAKTIPTLEAAWSGDGAVTWSDLTGFEVNDETSKLWNPSPPEPDWRRAERSARYAGIALSKVQRWLRARCLAVRDERTGLFRPTGPEWNYRDTAADCYPFYVWAAYYTESISSGRIDWPTTISCPASLSRKSCPTMGARLLAV
jgi:hypothetical protein